MWSDTSKLRDLLLLTKDGEWGKSEPDQGLTEALVIRGTDFAEVRYGDLESIPTRYIDDTRLERKRLRAGDILIETAGGTKGQPTGRTVIIREVLLNRAQRNVTCASFARFLRADPTKVLPEYLYWWLQEHYRSGQMDQHQVQHTGIARFQYTRFADCVLVPLPPRSMQERIAEFLDTVERRIAVLRRMNKTLEAISQTLFRSWFVDFDPVQAKAEGRHPAAMDPEAAALFPSKLVDSKLGRIPEGWGHQKVSDVVMGVFDGPHATPPEATHGPIFLGIKNLTGTAIDLSEVRHISESDWPQWTKRVEPRQGDIVFTYEATLGHFALIPPRLRCCLGRRTALARPKSDCHFLFHWFVGESFQRFLKTRIHPGATVDRILLTDFPSYPVLATPQALVDRFEALAAPIWSRIHANQSESRVLADLRDTLLPKLLSGEIRVNEAEDQLAASA
ncbi:MAG: restriction endonuclease subunit S [Myxococcaceae bacterium]|nr:restriction endonuclease subunit S [Myxococcaceae bacterium]